MTIDAFFKDPGTCLTTERTETRDDNRWPCEKQTAVRWFPRVVSSYAPTEQSSHWSQRLEADVEFVSGQKPWVMAMPTRQTANDFYGFEDADAAFLSRKPTNFVVFAKPGLLDDVLAAMLAEYWGCVHVSVANGLAADRDLSAAMALRRGEAVNACAALTTILGLDTDQVRERGYVLNGLPR